MSVAVGLNPGAVAELDWATFEALERAAVGRWTPLESMLADLLELVHAHYVAFLAVHLKKGSKLPQALHVPRPDADGEYPDAKPVPLSPLAFATAYGPSSSSSSTATTASARA